MNKREKLAKTLSSLAPCCSSAGGVGAERPGSPQSHNAADRSTWASAPIVFITPSPPTACPACGCLRHEIVRTMPAEHDGSRTRRCVCRECRAKFLVVVEPDFASDWQNH
jgi:hypothetical protein